MSAPFKTLPSLQALRCFEAAARLGAFTLAADELCITQSAVSHQIRSLEEGAGTALFQRIGNRTVLTKSGRILAAETRRALDYLSRAYGVVDSERRGTFFTLAIQFGITEHWLLPRLSTIRSLLGGVELHVVSLVDLVETPPDCADAAIIYGTGDVSGMLVERMADEQIFPVCSPGFLDAHPGLTLHRIIDMPLLLHSYTTWNLWLEKAGLPIRRPQDAVVFDDVALTIRSALEGQGIAMARSRLVEDYLASGRLVRPFELAVPGIFGYFLAWRSEAIRQQHLDLRTWLFDEMASKPSQPKACQR